MADISFWHLFSSFFISYCLNVLNRDVSWVFDFCGSVSFEFYLIHIILREIFNRAVFLRRVYHSWLLFAFFAF